MIWSRTKQYIQKIEKLVNVASDLMIFTPMPFYTQYHKKELEGDNKN